MDVRDRIVIGTSAGGVSALQRLIARLPHDLAAAVFVTIHMMGPGESCLPDILNRLGTLTACLAEDGQPIEDGRIYVAPPDHHLLPGEHQVRLGHGPREGLQRPSINVMLRAAAAAFGRRAAGVVLTGMLDDGAAGLWEIVQQGGAAIVQDPEEAAYRAMPESAIRGLNVPYILTLDEIAPLLTRLSMGERREAVGARPGMAQPAPESGTPRLTRQACPECGGVMCMEQRGGIKEYTCHVGHRLGLGSMIEDKTDVVERTMWAAVSQSEELIELLAEAQADGDSPVLASVQEEIDARRSDIATIRAVLERRKQRFVKRPA